MQLAYFFLQKYPFNPDYIFANSTNIKDLEYWFEVLEKKEEPYTVYCIPNMENADDGLNDFCIITRLTELT